MKIKFVDLFAGIGGIRIGFERAAKRFELETECVLSSEIDKKACETYALNFKEEPQGDIHEITSFPEFDFLLAGFPCQPFSYAGKQQGFGDTRGTLFFEVERVLRDNRPKAFLLENVRGLVTHDKGRTLKTIISKLEELGYGVSYLLLNSSTFGVPQNRVRIYILGILGSKPKLTLTSNVGAADSHKYKNEQISLFDESYATVKDILEDSPSEKYRCSDEFIGQLSKVVGNNFELLHGYRLIDYRGGNSIHSWELGIKGDCTKEEIEFLNQLIANRRKKIYGTHQDGKALTLEQIRTFYNHDQLEVIIKSLLQKGYLREEENKFNPVCGNMSFEVFKFLDPDSISITLTSSDAHKLGVVQNNVPRRITPRECARLQGFPDDFILHSNDNFAYKQLGNSVTVKVVEKVIEDLFQNNVNELFGQMKLANVV
ncbi:DNA cytosine methyltransferase [Aneurinibacillus aneurinilyticus]|uniref:Type II methyltransferase M.BanI n=2 Tax=Aneurinibacillus aneurinilyticus TaxID=1391 RepID=MTBA_ANEAE|nr:DNA cytosine methyltransferase [Aneurinibacillus aneurinilyticus]P19888.1 RecName: Full=Type II methyltransferase M.BanI; Short=M.BanI; AltName: Full=Cytosine-specific methyltransferase BanI; AltName: Full=Modification methylase BanI [Aneurinibacillus aneurinilyticus]ERI10687.1 modification methylase BanI [Aneurinibacillus aneurinilyticus ATCC 12856]MED0708504.1 DNA cytosine methyltransferase [Aneurinibacillus aneurinilyticus]MED0723176.1 DNA cytosine methyltransferase [Aneurinibacillus aneu